MTDDAWLKCKYTSRPPLRTPGCEVEIKILQYPYGDDDWSYIEVLEDSLTDDSPERPDWEANLGDGEYFALGSRMESRPDLEWHPLGQPRWRQGSSADWYVIARKFVAYVGISVPVGATDEEVLEEWHSVQRDAK